MPDFGEIDLLSRYLPEGDEQEKLFAVIAKGTSNPLPGEQEAASYLNQGTRAKKRVQFFPFPVLVVVFSMVDDDGYYAWQFEPIVRLGEPLLKFNKRLNPRRANRRGLDAITRDVDEWYQQQYRQFIVD
jgi:hypothetical protein